MATANDTMIATVVNYGCAEGALPSIPMDKDTDTMGDRIRTLRLARNLTQEQLGEKLGVTRAAVSQWELGGAQDIKLATFLALCAFFDTTPDYLVFGPEAPGRDSGGRFGRRRRSAS